MDNKKCNNLTPIDPEKLNKLFARITELAESYGDALNVDHIIDIVNIAAASDNYFIKGTTSDDDFFSLADIEELILEESRCILDANLKSLFQGLKKMPGEGNIILKKKKELREKGIRVRNWRYYSNSIITLVGRVPYERLALRASTPEDAKKLQCIGYKGYVYPIDEILQVAKVPYKMTVGAMLIVAKEAVDCDSYEQAQGRLLQRGIEVNDDTIRAVTNTIGNLVFENEKSVALSVYSSVFGGQWRFPDKKKPHTLYIELDGCMVPTRKPKETEIRLETSDVGKITRPTNSTVSEPERADKKSFWRENKLGAAFSTDNIFWWTDVHGERQHKILKKDFTCYIGEASEFNKLMLALAVRNGYGSYQDTVIISDGATWIREMKKEFYPDAQQILDFWHLCENVSNFAKSVFAMDETKYVPWYNEVKDLLKNSQTNEALIKINSLSKQQLSKASLNLANYIENNIDNIDYKSYLKKGYFIGSGFIESSNRTVVQNRAKLPGMRWNVESVQSIVTLKAKLRSNRWEEDVVKAIYDKYNVTPGRQFSLTSTKGIHKMELL
jgi:hypothetical protein